MKIDGFNPAQPGFLPNAVKLPTDAIEDNQKQFKVFSHSTINGETLTRTHGPFDTFEEVEKVKRQLKLTGVCAEIYGGDLPVKLKR